MSDHVYDLGPVISHGLWVVRWIDEIPRYPSSPGSPQLRFWFSRIYNPSWREVPFATAIEGPPVPPPSKSTTPTVATIVFATLHVGALTELRIGMVVKDGKPVGRLEASDERKFAFVLPDALPGPRRGLFPANTPAREVLGIDTEMHVMPANGYRFEARKDTFVTVLHDPSRPGRALVVPSAEVIRAFLAPVSEVARELLRWPPARMENGIPQPPYQLREIIGLGSAVISDKLWRLDLAKAISARHAPLIANLHPLFSPVGAMAAAEVFHAQQEDFVVRRERTARLAGMIPFTDCTLRFTARIIPLSDHHDLCLEITQVAWPYPGQPEIEVIRWQPDAKPGYDPDRVPGDRFETRPDCETEFDPNNDPDHRSRVTTFPVDGVLWEALPKPKSVEIAFRPDADRVVIDGETHREDQASTGPTAGGTGLAAGRLSQDLGKANLDSPGVPRFNLVIEMMETLKAAKAIADYKLVPAPARVASTQRGKHAVWSLSRKRAGRRRTLLVCEVEVLPGRKILWLEIEPRGQGHVSSTALLAVGRDLSDDEWRTLHTSTSKRRSFFELSAGTCLPTGAAFRKWHHGVSDRPLNAVRAVKVMTELANTI